MLHDFRSQIEWSFGDRAALGSPSWVFIDWDGAGPGSRLWDLAYAAHGFIPLAPQTPISRAGRCLVALADG